MELSSCHLSEMYNFEVSHRFWEDSCTATPLHWHIFVLTVLETVQHGVDWKSGS